MAQNRPGGVFSSLRMGGEIPDKAQRRVMRRLLPLRLNRSHLRGIQNNRWLTILPEVVREKVQDGLTGETREMQYTQCKIVGNGSFGVVFQTKLSPSGEDAAIKRVLQDKRFKVNRFRCIASSKSRSLLPRIENCRSCASCDIRIL